ncbi:MAG TPA: hypothetical protein VFX09_02990, partial [Burkholderiales bacterium]|nr:hypothetical protein [Burkholderiales bacterium]
MHAPSQSLTSRLSRAADLAYGLTAALGALAIWGWALGLPRLRDFGVDFPGMSPAAALGYLLLAASYLAASAGGAGNRRASYATAVLAGALALGALLERALGTSFGLDFAAYAAWRGTQPYGTLSAAEALALLLLACATPLTRDLRILRVPASSLAAAAAAGTAFFSLLGLSLRLLRLDVAAPLLGFSFPGALATLFAGFALGAARPSRWLAETLSGRGTGAVVTRRLLPAALVVPLAIGWLRLLAEREGFFSEAFGMALFTFAMIGIFSALVLWVARSLDQSAAQRALAEGQAGEQREWLHVTLASIGDGVIATD